ncbi:MAG: cyclic nucleotide-binding domain-containing protein [Betaproteobacteria bacterium]|nr:cyclic nucleotide-binding domain-containing protein [Betaproteobacteria bacterium]
MSPAEQTLTSHPLARFVPLESLSKEGLALFTRLAQPVELHQNEILFRKGDNDAYTYYLMEGEVSLDAEEEDAQTLRVVAGSDNAHRPISSLKPRNYTCRALAPCQLARIETAALDSLVARDQATAYEVTEWEGEDPQWMFELMGNPAFQGVPPSNLHELFGRFVPVQVKAGELILCQGAPGDYYYLLREGKARVTRKSPGGGEVTIAELGPGSSFGEEALISGNPRNASVTMETDGVLMRLPAADFNTLLKEPLVHSLDADGIIALMKRGAFLVDVRVQSEFKQGSLRGAVNLPLYLLRAKAPELPKNKPFILFCDSGLRANTAAFLLTQMGFETYVLAGGMGGLRRPV